MKLTPAQTKALVRFRAIKEGTPVKRGGYPDPRVIDALLKKGLLHYVTTERFDYLLQCNVPHNRVEISEAGLNLLSSAS